MSRRELAGIRIVPWALALALAGLLALLTVSSARNVHLADERMTGFLNTEADLIIGALEAGVRAGMVSPEWDVQDVQQHLLEIAQSPSVAFLAIADAKGTILFHSQLGMVGRPLPGFEAGQPDRFTRISSPAYPNVFLRSGRFAPLSEVRDWDTLKGRLLLQRWLVWVQRSRQANIGVEDLSDLRIFVGLKMDEFAAARRQEMRRAVLTTAVLFLFGAVGAWLLFFYAGVQTTRRAFRELRSVTDIIVRNLPTGLITVDAQGVVTRCNPEAERIMDLERAAAEGRPLRLALPEAEAAAIRVIAGEIPQFETELERPSSPEAEPKLVSLTVSPLRNEEGRRVGALLNLKDMTQLRRLERQIRRTENLVALGRFAAGVAHEIRNPLSSIRGVAQYLANKHKDEPADAESFQIIDAETERLNRKLTQLLTFARHEPPAHGHVDPADILRHVCALIEPDVRAAKIQFHAEVPANLAALTGNSDRLLQAFLNVLLNAVDAVEEGGAVSLRASNPDGKSLRVEIADNGVGIDPDDLERVFEPFFTTKSDGFGLGLAIVHRIVNDHGGTVEIESARGKGTRVILSFPAWEEATA